VKDRVERRGRVAALWSALALGGGCVFEMGPLPPSDHATGVDGDATTALETSGGQAARDDATSTSDADEPTTSPELPGECCDASHTAGCLDPVVETCVCALDPHCCELVWDELCVDQVALHGCGACRADADAGTQPCCTSSRGPGCEDEDIQACVCASNPYCCHVAWDHKCVQMVDRLGCDQCAPGPFEGSDCCVSQMSASCGDRSTAACVCAFDPYCCETAWDEICVAQVEAYDCGTCDSALDAEGDCCSKQFGPGCDDPELESCVCTLDAFCCQVAWDELCVEGALDDCGGCPDGGGETGGGSTGEAPEPGTSGE
jgi:hypothetical protein